MRLEGFHSTMEIDEGVLHVGSVFRFCSKLYGDVAFHTGKYILHGGVC